MKSALQATFAILLIAILSVNLSAQEVVVEYKFDGDDKEPAYQYAFGLAGYGESGGIDGEDINDQMKAEYDTSKDGGVPAGMLKMIAEKKAASKKMGDSHPSVVALGNKIAKLEEEKSGSAIATLDSTKLKIPDDASFEYAGWGYGLCHDLKENPLPSMDVEEYTVEFDAKVVGSRSLDASKLTVGFVVPDGEGLKEDDDDYDDTILQLRVGTDDGEGTFELTNEYQTFSYPMKDMTVHSGDKDKLKDFELKGITFVVQAQGYPFDIGTDKDNVLHVDNIRLVRNKKK